MGARASKWIDDLRKPAVTDLNLGRPALCSR
jgi:hypothetical protein